MIFWFQAAYAIGYLSFGRIVDVLGARLGYGIAFTIWTLGHTLCGFAGSSQWQSRWSRSGVVASVRDYRASDQGSA